jgi:hypothetical protein
MLTLAESGGRALRRSAHGCRFPKTIGRSKSEKLELHLEGALRPAARSADPARGRREIRNQDIRRGARGTGSAKLDPSRGSARPSQKVDEIAELVRRNIQKTIALDALIVETSRPGRGVEPNREASLRGSR